MIFAFKKISFHNLWGVYSRYLFVFVILCAEDIQIRKVNENVYRVRYVLLKKTGTLLDLEVS